MKIMTLVRSRLGLRLIQVIWVILGLVYLGLFAGAIPARLAELRQTSPGPVRAVHQLAPIESQYLREFGLSPEFYALYNLIFECLQASIYVLVGALIFWRKPSERMALFVSLTLIAFGISLPPITAAYRTLGPNLILATSTAMILVLLYVFPNGRFAPRWSWLLAVVSTLYAFLLPFWGQRFLVWPTLLNGLATILWFAPGLGAQIYRYQRISGPIERQQTKWIVYSLAVIFLGVMLNVGLRFIFPQIGKPGLLHLAYNLLVAVPLLETVISSLLPLAIAFSVLRYHLWDIDFVINRSLVYGLITTGLVGIFVLVFFVAQAALSALFGSPQSGYAMAISAAITGALFNPTRQRVQRFIDRRVYGFRFDLNELHDAQTMPSVENPGALSGRTLGDYHVLGVLGHGGMGEVYQGQSHNQMAALKILPPTVSKEEDFRKRFMREAQVLAQLDHPHIVKFYGAGEYEGVLFMAMELVDGQNLGALIRQRGTFSLDEIRPRLVELASALEYAHARGLVHRDLKPSNVMLRAANQQLVLMDFGIAKTQAVQTTLTGSGAIGTIDYMAPEQIMTASQVDHRADIYALGVMLFELLTGDRPFKGSIGQVLFGHLQQPPPDPRQLAPTVSEQVSQAIMKALEKKPDNRFQTVREFMAALG
jgi:predicted Ser/Thr protein kinase